MNAGGVLGLTTDVLAPIDRADRIIRDGRIFAEEPHVILMPSLASASSPPDVDRSAGIPTVEAILADPKLSAAPIAVVPRLAWAGRSTLLAAREKAGKSTLAAAAAAAVSADRRFLDGEVVAGPVLWIGVEEAIGDTANRLADYGCDRRRVYLLDRVVDPLPDLCRAVEETAPVLIVVDTLATFVASLDLDPGSSSAWTPVVGGLTRVARDSGAALLLLHHARKSDGRYRDSSAIGAGVDAILEMDEGGGGEGRKIRGRGRWAIGDCTLERILDPTAEGGDRWELASGELSLDARIVVYVDSHPECSQRDVRGNVQGKAREIDATLKKLLRAGAIEDVGDARGHAYRVPTGTHPVSQ